MDMIKYLEPSINILYIQIYTEQTGPVRGMLFTGDFITFMPKKRRSSSGVKGCFFKIGELLTNLGLWGAFVTQN